MKRQILTECQFRTNKRVADSLLQVVATMRPTRWNLRFVRVAFDYLAHVSTGYYSSDVIEDFYVGLSQRHFIPLVESCDKGSCLLVTQSVGGTGGHARVMERWIESDHSHRYSIVLLEEDASLIDRKSRIAQAVKQSGGYFFDVRDSDVIQRGLKLRRLASAYETIILFTFPWDVEHVIAFGNKDFKRPVGYYNAPDHMFWIGTSVIDACADIRKWGKKLTLMHRGIAHSMIIPVPMSDRNIPDITRRIARQRLSLPNEGRIILTAGRFVKYIPVSATEDFATLVDGVLMKDKNALVVCIGAKAECFNDWEKISEKWGDRFVLKQCVSHDQLLEYFRAADVVVDSYPFSGITTLEDAIACGVPIVSMSDRIDFVYGSSAYVGSKEELTDKILKICSDDVYAQQLVQEVHGRLLETSGMETFTKDVADFFAILGNRTHNVSKFQTRPSGLTMCERVRMNESAEYTMGIYDNLILKIGLIRPLWLSKLLYDLVQCLFVVKRILRYLLYPIVWATRPLRQRW